MRVSNYVPGLETFCFLLSGLLALTGCGGDESESGPGGGTGGAPAAGGAGGSGGTAGSTGQSQSFIVLGAWDREPIQGATVAFDRPGGQRVEAVSGADGKVTFDGIDWSAGSASVTAFRDGYALQSFVDLTAERLARFPLVAGAPPLWMLEPGLPPKPELKTVTGTITGLKDTSHSIVVDVVDPQNGTEWRGPSNGTFKVKVPVGKSFTLQAAELTNETTTANGYDMPVHQIMAQTFDAAANATDIVLDFSAHALPIETASVTVTLPARAESPVRRGFGIGLVHAPLDAFRYATGYSTHVALAADGNSFEDTLVWVESASAKDPVTHFRVLTGNPLVTPGAKVISYRASAGWPKAGVLGSLPDTPEWVTPPAGGTQPLHDPLEWKLFEKDVPAVGLIVSSGTAPVWIVIAGPDATKLTIPRPPSAVDPPLVFGSSGLTAFVNEGWSLDPGAPAPGFLWEMAAVAASEKVTLMP